MADLSGGLGVDSYFFAQVFAAVTYVEPNAELLTITAHNFGVLGVTTAQFVAATAEDFLRDSKETFDLLYLDPSRRHRQKGKVFQLEDCSPNILAIKALAFEKCRQPKKPPWADKGDGCGASRIRCFGLFICCFLLRAGLPHKKKTTGFSRRLIWRMISSVKCSQPKARCDCG